MYYWGIEESECGRDVVVCVCTECGEYLYSSDTGSEVTRDHDAECH